MGKLSKQSSKTLLTANNLSKNIIRRKQKRLS